MIINKEGKLFGKVSIIDIFVVLVLIAAVLGIYTRFFNANERVAVQKQQIEYKLKITKVRENTYDALMKMGPVFDATTKEAMGTITAVEKTDSYEELKLTDGSIVNAKVPERVDVIITVKTDGNVTSSGYYTGDNKYLAAGGSFVISTKYAKTSGEIINVSEID